MMSLTTELKSFAEEVGFDIARVTSAESFSEAADRIKKQIRLGFKPMVRVEDIDAYCNPRSVLPDAKSILVVAECYLASGPVDLSKPGDPHGRIARYTWSNYYYDVKKKLKTVARFLKKKVGAGFRFKYFSNGPLAEKPMAERAGVGWYGKHGIVVTERFGSWIVLGELITNVKLEEDEPIKGLCGGCQACVEACPTKALVKPYILDVLKCLQYVSNHQMVIPEYMRELWGNRLYGCTTCQEACPINRRVKPKDWRPSYGYIGPSLSLVEILRMKDDEYRRRFHRNQIGHQWVSFRAIQRNAAVALGNIGDPIDIPALSQTLESNRSIIVRMHAAWALGKIGGQEAKLALEKTLRRNPRPEVKREIVNAIRRLEANV